MTTPPSIPEALEVQLDFCWAGGLCQWSPVRVPALNAWRHCPNCGDVQYRARGGWTRVLGGADRDVPPSCLTALWRHCSAEWSILYPWAKNRHLVAKMDPAIGRLHE